MSKSVSDKKTVKALVDVCQMHGLTDVVLSPGSRNAPLIITFTNTESFRCHPVVDERSAGFFALGIAQQTRKPVALVCTSGTAVLNYAPAIAEAYYQNLPLIVITADRPEEWIDQADGQTIRQRGVFENFIKYQCSLPVEIESSQDEWYVNRVVNEAFVEATDALNGPVHINVPLREPLYGRTVHSQKPIRVLKKHKSSGCLPQQLIDELSEVWKGHERIMILVGMRYPDNELKEVLEQFGESDRVVVLTETLSNCCSEKFVQCIDRVVSSIRDEDLALFKPDILITMDGVLVSKMLKTFLRQNAPREHWHISEGGIAPDSYQGLTKIIKGQPVETLRQLMSFLQPVKCRFRETWMKRVSLVASIHDEYVKKLPWSDMKVFEMIIHQMPRPVHLQLGNSTPVRYVQLFDGFNNVSSFSNRGTSGIDGSVSTAVGAAYSSNHPTLLLVGDLSFFYDSNGLWNKRLSPNLKIIVINNSGGGIFRFLQGPAEADELEEFFATSHHMSAEHVARQYGLPYRQCTNEQEFAEGLIQLFEPNDKSFILEVMTPVKDNARTLRDYFAALKRACS
jgi:2-succinyl-5-enolpyruvyl-6-hydroxy-3-cyclohexene-1-carboxylate synthase